MPHFVCLVQKLTLTGMFPFLHARVQAVSCISKCWKSFLDETHSMCWSQNGSNFPIALCRLLLQALLKTGAITVSGCDVSLNVVSELSWCWVLVSTITLRNQFFVAAPQEFVASHPPSTVVFHCWPPHFSLPAPQKLPQYELMKNKVFFSLSVFSVYVLNLCCFLYIFTMPINANEKLIKVYTPICTSLLLLLLCHMTTLEENGWQSPEIQRFCRFFCCDCRLLTLFPFQNIMI